MTDYLKLKIPSKERLDVQILDGTPAHKIVQIITAKVREVTTDKVLYTFKLYDVDDKGKLTLLESNDSEPKFKKERKGAVQ